jgi:hypothetical protein
MDSDANAAAEVWVQGVRVVPDDVDELGFETDPLVPLGAAMRLRLNRWHDAAAAPSSTDSNALGGGTAAGGRVPLLPQVLEQVYGVLPVAALRQAGRPWRVEFVGEGGTDAGGLSAEALTSVVEELMDFGSGVAVSASRGCGGGAAGVAPLFVPTPNARRNTGADRDRVVPNPLLCTNHGCSSRGSGGAHVSSAARVAAAHRLVFVGHLIGHALRTSFPLPLRLPLAVWKLVVGERVGLDDLALIDAPLADVIRSALAATKHAHAGADAATVSATVPGVYFAIPSLDGGRAVELVPGGAATPVTAATAPRFAALALAARVSELQPAAACIATGLAAVVPLPLLRLAGADALEARACGSPGIDVDVLRAHTQYEGFAANSPVVEAFWRVVRAMTPTEQESLLRFVYARKRLPPAGAPWPHEFVVARMGRDDPDASLPAGHSCFFRLDLPAYSSADVLRARLLFAAENSIDYDLDGGARGWAS